MNTTISLINAIGSIATPILVLILGAVGWTVRNRIEQARTQEQFWREREEQLREDRIKIYDAVLEPFILAFSRTLPKEAKYKNKSNNEVVSEIMLSLQYRQASFRLALMGSDSVVESYNNLMQFFYENADSPNSTPETSKKMLELLGDFLLEIRRSVGNPNTGLTNYQMLEWMIKDIRRIQDS